MAEYSAPLAAPVADGTCRDCARGDAGAPERRRAAARERMERAETPASEPQQNERPTSNAEHRTSNREVTDLPRVT